MLPSIAQGTISFAEFLELISEVMALSTRWGSLSTKLDGYVGFDTIQDQIRKKNLKRGFEFNLMVVGTFPAHRPRHVALSLASTQVRAVSGSPHLSIHCLSRASADRPARRALTKFRAPLK